MKKSSISKKIFSLTLATMCVVSMAGCGKKEGSQIAKKENTSVMGNAEGMVYVPEYQSVDVDNIYNSVLSDGTFYFIYSEYNEETEKHKQGIKSIKIGETEAEELPITFDEMENPYAMMINGSGELVLVISKNISESAEEYRGAYFLRHYSKDGTLISDVDITSISEGTESFYLQYLQTDAEGNVYLSSGEQTIWLMDKEGNQAGTVTVDNWISSMFSMPDGKVAVCSWGDRGDMEISVIDFAAKAIGKTYANVPSVYNGSPQIYDGDKLLIVSNNGVQVYDPAAESATELLNWIDSDLNGEYIRSVYPLEDGRIFAISQEYSEEKTKTEFVYLKAIPAAEVTEKTVITFGAMYLDSALKKSIIDFNKTNDTYRISVKEYYGESVEDYEQAVTQLNTEIISGNGPDIIDLNNMDIDMYITKGVLEDLTPFIEADAEIKSEDYVQKAFNAYKTDAGMYGIVPSFSVQTILAKTSDVGSEMGWTIDDVIALLDSKPEGTELLGYETKEHIIQLFCGMSIDRFVDWESGECKFDDGYFEKVLEFANRYPTEIDYAAMQEEESVPSKIQSGKLLAQALYITEVNEYKMYSAMFGEPTTFIGYPTNGGNGTFIRPGISIGMSTGASNKEGAWAFLRTLLQEEYQKSVQWSFPVLNSALEAVFEENMKQEYYEDENGEQVPQPKTTWSYDDFELEIFAATQEEIDSIKNLIDSADGIASNSNNEIMNIIKEEAAAYFDGQKDAKSVADLVQSRVKIYVNENR